MVTHHHPGSRSERVIIRIPDCQGETWLRVCADSLRELGQVELVAWMGRRCASSPEAGDAWIDESGPDAPQRLRRAAATLVVDLSELPLPPGFGRLRRWMPVFGAAAAPQFSFAGSLLDHRRAVLARLVEVTGAGTGRVLEEGRLRPVPHSPNATHRRLLNVIARWPARVLGRARAGVPAPGTIVSIGAEVGAPSHSGGLAARAGALLARLESFGVEESWAIGVINRPLAGILEGGGRESIRWLPSPAGAGLADPFALARGDGLAILAELVRDTQPGVIVSCGEAGTSEPRPVLPSDRHASYPFLIEDEEDVLMLPELATSGRLQLFRADPFPDRWLPDAVLLEDVAAVDPTVVRYQERWWLFLGDLSDQADARLHLFMAERLRGPWQKHPCSPVKDDLASARPAGTPFVVQGRLYRPAQDCSRRYGGAVVIHRVDVLTPEAYAETAVLRIDPDPAGPYPHGVHTVSAAGELTLIDGKRERRSLRALLHGLRRSLRWHGPDRRIG
jgi:hypothetical protein